MPSGMVPEPDRRVEIKLLLNAGDCRTSAAQFTELQSRQRMIATRIRQRPKHIGPR